MARLPLLDISVKLEEILFKKTPKSAISSVMKKQAISRAVSVNWPS